MRTLAITDCPPPPARLQNRAALALRAYEAVSDAIDVCGPQGSLKVVLSYLGGRRRALATAQGLPKAGLYGVWRDGQLDPAHRTQVTYFGPGHPPYERVVQAYAYLYAQKDAPATGPGGGLLAGTVQAGCSGEMFELTQYRCDLTGETPRNRRWLHTHWTKVAPLLVRAGELFEMALEPIDDTVALGVIAELHWWLTHTVPFAYGSSEINTWLMAYIFRLRGHGGVRFAQDPAALAFVAQTPESYREAFAANLQFIPTRVPAPEMPAARQFARDARMGHLRAVQRHLKTLDPNLAEPTGQLPLHLAARQGQRRVVALLLRHGANVHAQLPDSAQTPLHLAVREGHVAVVKQLLRCGAALHVVDFAGRTPLHVAVAMGHVGCALLLLRYGAPLGVRDHEGSTPLHLAAPAAPSRLIKRLLQQKDSAASCNIADYRGETPLSLAALQGQADTVRRLLRAGAEPPVTALGDDTLHPILAELAMAVLELGGCLHLFGLLVRCGARGQVGSVALLIAALIRPVARAERRALQQIVEASVFPAR